MVAKSYHIIKDSHTFHIYVSSQGGHNFQNMEREVASGVLNDPAAYEEAIRMVAHANVALAMMHAIECSQETENSVKSGASLLR